MDLASIKQKSLRGGVVTMASQGLSTTIQLISTVVLARLLTPEDYGIVAMVLAITAFAGLFRDLGLSAAAVQKKDLTHSQLNNLFWLNVCMGAVLTLTVMAAAPLVSRFYNRPELTPLMMLLSATFVIGSFGTQHGALLQREMMFERRSLANISGALAGLIASISLALIGWKYWALAWGTVANSLCNTVVISTLSPFRVGRWTPRAGIRSLVKFGAHITAFDFINYFHRNLDNILIGRIWGADALGLYSKAYSLLMLPISQIRGPIQAVAFPALSRLQAQPDAYRAYYRQIVGYVALASMPFVALMIIVAGPLIEIALGSPWMRMVPVYSVLAISGFIQPVASLRGLVLLSSGHGRRYLYWGILNAVCVCAGFIVGVGWGAMGVAVAYACVNYALLYPSLALAFRGTALIPSDFFRPIIIPAVSSISAASVCYSASIAVPSFAISSAAVQLGSITFMFVGTYLLILTAFPTQRLKLRNIGAALIRQVRYQNA